jgi:hypothetical protein
MSTGWLIESKTTIKKSERGKRRWCVITDSGMTKCFNSMTEARKYKRKLDFWKREFVYDITKRPKPWLAYRPKYSK